MPNLNDIINLAKADGGKFFVIDETGEPQLVIMGIDDYQTMLLGKLQRQVSDVEDINKEIIKAQLAEEPVIPPMSMAPTLVSQSRDEVLRDYPEVSKNDLRAEVIDPSFDFEGPKVEIDDL